MVATVDFYSKSLADALAEIERQRLLIDQLTDKLRRLLQPEPDPDHDSNPVETP